MRGCHGATMWTSCPRAAMPFAIGSMKVPTESPGNLGYDVVTITTTSGMSARAEHEAPRHDQRFDQHVARQLRLSLAALDEDDGDLADAQATAAGLVQHLDEERVAVRDHVGDRHPRQGFATPAAVPAGAVRGRERRDEADVAIAERA